MNDHTVGQSVRQSRSSVQCCGSMSEQASSHLNVLVETCGMRCTTRGYQMLEGRFNAVNSLQQRYGVYLHAFTTV